VDGAGDQSVAFEVAQCEGEHALGDARDLVVQIGEAQRALIEGGDHEQGPLVADLVASAALIRL
jgi:hypothetical protein